ncbi:MAG: hypothetical protein MZV65_37590 [Chromatiales bacterium]|nr:hypothetical protein [Chromatiales bacterium]
MTMRHGRGDVGIGAEQRRHARAAPHRRAVVPVGFEQGFRVRAFEAHRHRAGLFQGVAEGLGLIAGGFDA